MAIPLLAAAGIGAAGNILGGVLGGKAASKAADKASAEQRAAFERSIAILESVGIPSIEAQEIALNNPEYAGELIAEIMGDSALTEISTDPQLRQNQMDVLAQLQQMSETGLGTQDRIALDQAQQEVTADDAARRAQILQQMMERGTADSGAQLAMQLASTQQANQQANQQAQNIASQAAQSRINAMNMLANQSRGLEDIDYNRAARAATAQDEIQRFNVGTRNTTNQYNLGQKQQLANQKAATQNQQEIYNKGLIQQDYQNRLNQAQSKVGLTGQQGQNLANTALQKGQGEAGMYQGIGQGIGNAATAFGSYFADQEKKKV